MHHNHVAHEVSGSHTRHAACIIVNVSAATSTESVCETTGLRLYSSDSSEPSLTFQPSSDVSNARLAGMQEDCNMTDVQWSTGISLFYVGYIISQIPANVIIAKGKPQILLPCCMLMWSAVTICMTAMKSPWAFMLCRFLVGFTEGPFLPAVSLMTTKHESPLR